MLTPPPWGGAGPSPLPLASLRPSRPAHHGALCSPQHASLLEPASPDGDEGGGPRRRRPSFPGGATPYDLYVKAVEDDLLGPLRNDARITEDILQQVKKVYLSLPADIQARVLLTAIQHPSAKPDASPSEQAQHPTALRNRCCVQTARWW